ncbi:MAG: flavodoxin [Solirubrobacterales bacterium]|jgi:menaquinone-dependent protoporphyrinogen oxidase|nr:flavodoxin [Solirubrobacterales bacterium]
MATPTPSRPPRVLVAYGSRHGATAEIAEAIAGGLRAADMQADCLSAGEAATVEGYDAVVLGSAVYMKRWRPEARLFLKQHARELEQRPFWVFSSGPVGEVKDPDPEWEEPAKVIALAEQLGVREHVVFGGRVPEDPSNFVERAMARNTPEEVRDRRDWTEIRSWAAGIAAQVRTAGTPARS